MRQISSPASFPAILAFVTLLHVPLVSAVPIPAPGFDSQAFDVVFSETGYVDITTGITTVGSGPEISANDGSDIGDLIMLENESIDFDSTTVTFMLRGDGAPYSTGYQTMGFSNNAAYILKDFQYSIHDVTLLGTTNIIDLTLGNDITWNQDELRFDLTGFGIGETAGIDMGSVMLDVQFVVPVPPALPLMLSGILGVLFIARRRR